LTAESINGNVVSGASEETPSRAELEKTT